MTWKINPLPSIFDYYEGYEITEHNVDTVLTLGDLRKTHVMDVSGGERAFWLPTVSASNVNSWVIIGRKGAANLLRVWAGGTNKIFNSTAGGYIECNEAVREYSCILLVVMANGQWGNPSYGIWSSH